MKKIGVTILTLFTLTTAFCDANVENVREDGTYDVTPSGSVF